MHNDQNAPIQITKLIFLTSILVTSVGASENIIQMEPISVSTSEISQTPASFTLDPTTPATSSLTLGDLLLSEGLGTKAMKGLSEESIVFRGLSQDSTLFLIDDIPM